MRRADPLTRAMFVTLLVALWLGSGAAMAVVTGAIVFWPVAALDAIQTAAQLGAEGVGPREAIRTLWPSTVWIAAAFSIAAVLQAAWSAVEAVNVRRCSSLMLVALTLAVGLVHLIGAVLG